MAANKTRAVITREYRQRHSKRQLNLTLTPEVWTAWNALYTARQPTSANDLLASLLGMATTAPVTSHQNLEVKEDQQQVTSDPKPERKKKQSKVTSHQNLEVKEDQQQVTSDSVVVSLPEFDRPPAELLEQYGDKKAVMDALRETLRKLYPTWECNKSANPKGSALYPVQYFYSKVSDSFYVRKNKRGGV